MRFGKETIFAQTDGGLQIVIPRKDDKGNEIDEEVIYERAYYKLALEVIQKIGISLTCLVKAIL